MRMKKGLINTLYGLLYEGVALICGLILPRLILNAFGSDYNGITNSISQFLSCIVLLRAGIAGVAKAALYKPLEQRNTIEISRILRATEIFLRKVAFIFLGFVCILACVYPCLVNDEFEWLFTASLILILGITTFVQYYFGLTYQILLQADQNQRVIFCIQIVTTILNTLIAALLIKAGAGIHTVKLGSALVFALNPICINAYAKKKYKIVHNVEPDNDVVKQRWDAFAHQVALFVMSNTDIVVLTILSNVREVSVYSVYYLVINGLTRLFKNCISGIDAAFGNMMAKQEQRLMAVNFRMFELVVFSLATIIYVTTGIMLVPFVMIYTTGVTDVNYSRPIFSFLIVVAAFFGCVRMPYQQIVEAAGHYKQTKKGAFMEAGMNIVLSVIGVFRYGLTGVAFGTLAATVFRTLQYSAYLSDKIVRRNKWYLAKHLGVSAIVAVVTVFVYRLLPSAEMTSYLVWIQYATVVCVLAAGFTVITNLCFFKEDSMMLLRKIKNMKLL